jgi:hypothetical protein
MWQQAQLSILQTVFGPALAVEIDAAPVMLHSNSSTRVAGQ